MRWHQLSAAWAYSLSIWPTARNAIVNDDDDDACGTRRATECQNLLSDVTRVGAPMRVTMREVADRAEVSLMTVSRVLSGRPGVSEATAKAVRDAAELVGYRKNELARSLRLGQKSRMIALVIGDISNPFYGVLAQAIETYARGAGYAVVIYSTNEDPDLERRGVNGSSRPPGRRLGPGHLRPRSPVPEARLGGWDCACVC